MGAHLLQGASFGWMLFHPLRGQGYQFWSGIAGSFLVSLPGWSGAALLFYLHHNCHVHYCLRRAWHPDPKTGHPVCKVHHPDHPKQSILRKLHRAPAGKTK